MPTPNRLEDHWDEIRPLLLKEWVRLSEADLDWTQKQFDRLVEVIRQRYGGRVEIIQEAGIRNTVLNLLAKIEAEAPSA